MLNEMSPLMIEKGPVNVVASVTFEDLDAILDIHRQAFPQSFMTKLGTPFLRRYFRVAFMLQEKHFFVLRRGNESVGYARVITEPSKLHVAMASNRIGFAGALIYGLFRRPHLLLNVLRGVARSSRGRTVVSQAWELVSIGCSISGEGVGSALLLHVLQELEKRGGSEMTLTTDRYNNEGAIAFYEKHGFRKVAIEKQGGRDVFRMSYRA